MDQGAEEDSRIETANLASYATLENRLNHGLVLLKSTTTS